MNKEIEAFRVLGAFGIVWFHSGVEAGRDAAYGGLIFFVVVSVYYATVSTRPRSVFDRARRLLVPWIVWAAFYGAVNLTVNGRLFPEDYGLLSRILASPAVHLWFLPFLFFALVAIDRSRRYLATERGATLIGSAAALSLLLAPIWRGVDYATPLAMYAHAMPAVFIGVFLGVMDGCRLRTTLLSAIAVSVLVMVFKRQAGVGDSYLVGLAPCVLLFRGHVVEAKASRLMTISSATLGVYLLHPFAMMLLRRVDVDGAALPVLGFACSLLVIVCLRAVAPERVVRLVC